MSLPPVPPANKYWGQASNRQRYITTLFDRSAAHYDRVSGILAWGTGAGYRRAALVRAGLAEGMTVLDVGTGTGLLARAIVGIVGARGRVVGVDPSAKMLAAGRPHSSASLVQALGEQLPFPDAHFDFVTMGYALRHVSDLDQMFDGYRRVLKPGGRLLLLEITKPKSRLGALLTGLYFRTYVRWVTRTATMSADAAELMRLYWDTITNCVAPETVLASMRRGGFVNSERALVGGLFSEYTAERPT